MTIANRVQFFKVAGLMAEMVNNPSIPTAEEYIHKVLAIIDEVDEVNEVISCLHNAFYQYQLDAQRREQHHGV
jgi:hypothetical protein